MVVIEHHGSWICNKVGDLVARVILLNTRTEFMDEAGTLAMLGVKDSSVALHRFQVCRANNLTLISLCHTSHTVVESLLRVEELGNVGIDVMLSIFIVITRLLILLFFQSAIRIDHGDCAALLGFLI